jgi:hypothetical protein
MGQIKWSQALVGVGPVAILVGLYLPWVRYGEVDAAGCATTLSGWTLLTGGQQAVLVLIALTGLALSAYLSKEDRVPNPAVVVIVGLTIWALLATAARLLEIPDNTCGLVSDVNSAHRSESLKPGVFVAITGILLVCVGTLAASRYRTNRGRR